MSHDDQGNWTGDQTIGELTIDESVANDAEMFESLKKDFKKYYFRNTREAVKFVAQCVGESLEYLGMKNVLTINDLMIDRFEKGHNIKVESRDHYKGADIWRNGLYIYKKDILVRFISAVLTNDNSLLILPGVEFFYVITNCDTKKMFH